MEKKEKTKNINSDKMNELNKLNGINEKLLDNKMILRIKENVVREYYARLNKSSIKDKEEEDIFQIKFKRLMGEKLTRKQLHKSKIRTKKIKI